jgi:transcription elongation GreA/GreB family factor
MDKALLLKKVIEDIEAEIQILENSAKSAAEAATDPESKPENQYDTRGLEASYLAGAQAARIETLRQQIEVFSRVPLHAWKTDEAIAPGALVTLVQEDTPQSKHYYLMVPVAGGHVVRHETHKILTLAPQSPLGDALMGRKRGENFDVDLKKESVEYHILQVV